MALIIGNWKMNGLRGSLAELDRIAGGVASASVEVRLALPATLIALAAKRDDGILIGAQDVHEQVGGAHTGSLSATMIRDAGAHFTLIGHSERRPPGGYDDDVRIAAKLAAARNAGLSVVLCVGETGEDRIAARTGSVVAAQLRQALPDAVDGRWLAIAYEPRWAIGNGSPPLPSEIATIHALIRSVIDPLTIAVSWPVPVLYGGSVDGVNANAIISTDGVDGLLVGNASLSADRFLPILAATTEIFD